MGPRGRGRGRGDWNMGAPGGLQEVTYTIPADKCGLVIGKGEENVIGGEVRIMLVYHTDSIACQCRRHLYELVYFFYFM